MEQYLQSKLKMLKNKSSKHRNDQHAVGLVEGVLVGKQNPENQ